MLTVKLEYEVVSMFWPIQLTLINEYEPHRFKTLDFIHCNEIIIDDLFKLYSWRKLNHFIVNLQTLLNIIDNLSNIYTFRFIGYEESSTTNIVC